MVKSLRILLAAADELFEQVLREVIEGGGHHLTIMNPWNGRQAFLDTAGGCDVVIVTNLGFSLDYSLGLIAPVRQSCGAQVIVMSGMAGQGYQERANNEGAVAFYKLPISGEQILEAVEAAAPIGYD